MELTFEWDNRKAVVNLRKHGISFEEAKTVFTDPRRLEYFDEEHSIVEDRFRVIGISNRGRLLLVIHARKGKSGIIVRIISARRATKAEEHRYAEIDS